MPQAVHATCSLCRREGEKLFLKGARCFTPKCAVSRRPYPSGKLGVEGKPRKQSEYGQQLREKQKMKRMYGLREKQFRATFAHASATPGVTGDILVQLLERRLDNVVFRAGFATSRAHARQLVAHGHFGVNGQVVNIPSYRVAAGDVVAVDLGSKGLTYFADRVKVMDIKNVPSWLVLDVPLMQVKVTALPDSSKVGSDIDTQLIVELYSR